MKDTVTELLGAALATLQSEGTLPADQSFTPQVGNTRDNLLRLYHIRYGFYNWAFASRQ